MFSVTDMETIISGQNTLGPIYQSTIPVDSELRLYQFNAQEVLMLYPLIFFYGTILIVGVFGNALVLLVYSFRYKRSSARVYILFLATIDLSMCSFGLPYHLIDLTHPFTFTNEAICKTLTFIITMLFHTSIFGLIVIAIDRYLKICKPLGKIQLSNFGRKRSCIAAVVIGIFVSWPNIVLYGQSEMEDLDANITGYSCYFQTEYLETNYPFIYIMTTLSVCIGSTIFLIVAYSMICHQILTRYSAQNIEILDRPAFADTTRSDEISLKNFVSSALDVNVIKRGKPVDELNEVHVYSASCGIVGKRVSDVDNLYDDSLIVQNRQNMLPLLQDTNYTGGNLYTRKSGRYSLHVPNKLGKIAEVLSCRRTSDLTGANSNKWAYCQSRDSRYKSGALGDKSGEGLRIHTGCQSVAKSRLGIYNENRTIPKKHYKITKIMLSITIIFILSYTPALIVTIWSIVNPEFWDILNPRETIVCEFFLRFYLVNNICNPFIYGFWDKRFKQEIIYTFRKIRYEIKYKCMCFLCCTMHDF